MGKQETWRNRIIGTAEVPPDSLLAHPSNWRGHPANQQNALTDILGDEHGVGWVARVMVNKRTSEEWPEGDRNVETVVDGHLRVALAMRHNQPTVPVDYVDLTPAEEALVLATFDPISALAQANAEQLDAVLREVQTGSEAVGQMLADLAGSAGLYGDGVPSLDELEAEHGEPGERDFWPFVRVQVSPETMEKYTDLMTRLPGVDEATKFDALVSGVVASRT